MRSRLAFRVCVTCVLCTQLVRTLESYAQEASAPQPTSPPPTSQSGRPLGEGVLTVIPTDINPAETATGPLPLIEITLGHPELDWNPPPNFTPKSQTYFELAKTVTLRREIWNFEFAFKPLRMIYVDLPQPSGQTQRKQIWYIVYRVKYMGNELVPKAQQDRWNNTTFPAVGEPEPGHGWRRFFPHFVLRSHEYRKEYLDRVLPAAKMPILRREFPGKTPGTTALAAADLHNSVEMMRTRIPISDENTDRSVWGLVTWEDIDPRIDYFSVFVQGLTNAFRFSDPPGAYKPGDPPGTGRIVDAKTLQLNFWRPGDSEMAHEDEIRFGVPVETNPRLQERILNSYGWFAPAEVFEGDAKVGEIDASVDFLEVLNLVAKIDATALTNLDPAEANEGAARAAVAEFLVDASAIEPLLPSLKSAGRGTSLEERLATLKATREAAVSYIRAGFAAKGLDLEDDLTVSVVQKEWIIDASIGGAKKQLKLQRSLNAERFQVVGDSVLFKERLDYLWVYR